MILELDVEFLSADVFYEERQERLTCEARDGTPHISQRAHGDLV